MTPMMAVGRVDNMKCPVCGYSEGKKYNPSKRILELLTQRTTKTKEELKSVIREIRNNIPSDNNNSETFFFLQAISNIEDKIVSMVVNKYTNNKYYYSNKGFKYLRNMIIRDEKNKEMTKKNEAKRFGKTPKRKKVERKEYKDVYERT